MKKFWEDLRKHAADMINREKKEVLTLKKKQLCHIYKQEFNDMFNED